MSDVLKLNVKSKILKAFVPDSGSMLNGFSSVNEEEEVFKKELENQYKKGYEKGFEDAKTKLEKEYTDQLISKSEEFYNILSSFEEKLVSYEVSFDKIIIQVSTMIAKKILQYELESKSIIESTLKNAVKKVLGANEVIIQINPADYQALKEDSKNNSFESSFSKIKFEQNDRIERGGCLIETDIGNVDARISSQLSEITKQLENKLFNNNE